MFIQKLIVLVFQVKYSSLGHGGTFDEFINIVFWYYLLKLVF